MQHKELEKKLLVQMLDHLHTKEKELKEEIERKVTSIVIMPIAVVAFSSYLRNSPPPFPTCRKRNHLKHKQKNWNNGKRMNRTKLRSTPTYTTRAQYVHAFTHVQVKYVFCPWCVNHIDSST